MKLNIDVKVVTEDSPPNPGCRDALPGPPDPPVTSDRSDYSGGFLRSEGSCRYKHAAEGALTVFTAQTLGMA
jgi:hypothetical protein